MPVNTHTYHSSGETGRGETLVASSVEETVKHVDRAVLEDWLIKSKKMVGVMEKFVEAVAALEPTEREVMLKYHGEVDACGNSVRSRRKYHC